MKYYGLDGDKVGKSIEIFFIRENENKLKEFSNQINEALMSLSQRIKENNGETIFYGGDTILFKGNFEEEFCYELIDDFKKIVGCNASIGVGNTLTEVFLGLKIAKTLGGGKIYTYGNE